MGQAEGMGGHAMRRFGATKLVVAFAAVAAVLAAGQPPAGARADRIGATGSITEYNLPAGAGTESTITYGPDGRLWFPELFHDQVGTITTKGVIVNYPIASGSSVYTATPGADGNIWLAEHDSKKIGVMSTSGVIQHEYPFASSAPYGITAGSDGDLWWTDEFAGTGKIGQTTTSGSTVEFSNPVDVPRDITPGPDGNLWFTAYQEHDRQDDSERGHHPLHDPDLQRLPVGNHRRARRRTLVHRGEPGTRSGG